MGFFDTILRKSKSRSGVFVISLGIGCILMFAFGILIGRFAACPASKTEENPGQYLPGVSEALVKDGDPEVSDLIINSISSDKIRENLRMLSQKPHLGGGKQNHELAKMIRSHWLTSGLDHVRLTPYEVMLSYPDPDDPNYVELLNERNETVYKSNLTEPVLTPEEDKPGVVPPFNAYSAPGDIYGDLVYVNYGRVEDYLFLENNMSINVSGKIAFARYGKIFRGDKVRQAEIRGAIGVILFSDPEDVTNGDFTQVYPKDWWLPPSGAQRGTVYIGDGDPLTAGYPAISTAYRETDTGSYLPRIPSHPIGYGIAVHLMRNMGGDAVPAAWQGGMKVTYRFGNGFLKRGWRAHISVSTSNKNMTVYNAIGTIRGNIEPDRYVLVGNHRDAWAFGAVDPGSGTAIMMEISRVMGELVKSNRWRPRRSILFCSWGAEEYGLIGSTEWVEHYTKSVGARAVAYLNMDVVVQGNYTLRAQATPMLFRSLYEATKRVPNPTESEIQAGRNTVYDTWLATKPWEKFNRPLIVLPGSGSDYTPFRDRLGVPVLDLRYTWDSRLGLSAYPMYHSVYETFYLVDKFMDLGFIYHKAIGQIISEMSRNLADSLIIPFDVSDYSAMVKELLGNFMRRYRRQLNSHGINTNLLDEAVENFTQVTENFHWRIQSSNLNDPFVVRRINDQLMNLDRAFLDPVGLPGRKLKRHILFAESIVDKYAGNSFPGLSDALAEIRVGRNISAHWETVKRHFSVLLFTFQSAASTLREVDDFMYNY